MKAVIINAPGDYGVYEVERPVCPEDGLLVKVLAAGLCGGDLRTLRAGHHRVKLPYIIGHEVSAEVVEKGLSCGSGWNTGDRLAIAPVVYCGACRFCMDGRFEYCEDYKELAQHWPGGFAEYMAIPAEALLRGSIQKIPDGLDPVYATLAEPLSSVINAHQKGNTGQGDTVVIIGAGPVGTLHLELARIRGAKCIIIADIESKRLELIKEFNPDYLVNSSETDLVEKVREITEGKGADVVITANAVPATQVQAVEMAGKGGRILLFGGLPKDQSKPGIDMNMVHYKALTLTGTTIFAPEHNRLAMDLIAGGKINAGKLISHVLPLSAFHEGVKLAMDGKARKVVYTNRYSN